MIKLFRRRHALSVFMMTLPAAAAAAAYFIFIGGAAAESSPRWYTAEQASAGEKLFAANCASCHGERGQSAAGWQQRLPDGSYPPPPLNGSAHTWHHPMAALKRTIKKGGAEYGGNMPAFENQLSDEQIEQVIAYFQSQWPDEIYQVWEEKVNKRR